VIVPAESAKACRWMNTVKGPSLESVFTSGRCDGVVSDEMLQKQGMTNVLCMAG